MRYCSKCGRFAEEEKCPKCKRKMQEVSGNDPVLLSAMDSLTAAMLEPLLQDAGIPHSRIGTVGTAIAISGGMTLEEIRIYVPFSAYEEAQELLETISARDTVQ